MKTTKILFWVFNGLLCALMLWSAIGSFAMPEQTNEMVVKHFGYPTYFMGLLSVAKILGVIALLVPGFPRLKEWAYAGFAFDLIYATYSSIEVHDPAQAWGFMFVFILIFALAYIYHLKKQRAVATGGNS
ncbi:MAG: DoxX family protein [Bacteroidota bacterium]